MAGNSEYVQLALANWFRGTAMPTAPASLELALSTVSISDDGSNIAEPSVLNGYARQAITLTAPVHTENAGTLVQNSSPIVFPTITTATWGTIVAAAVFDTVSVWSSSAVPLIVTAPLGASLTLATGPTELLVTFSTVLLPSVR